MTALVIILGVLAVGPLAVVFGRDSRHDDAHGRHRPNWR
jgi:hypothetical protein